MGEEEMGKRMIDIREAISYREALAPRFQGGRIVVEHGGNALDLEPPSVVILEIEAKPKKEKTKFGFEIAGSVHRITTAEIR